MVSIAQTVWLPARNLSAALMLLALGVHPSFAQMVPLSCGSPDTARLWAPRRGVSVPLALEEHCLCRCRKEALHDYAVAPAGPPLASATKRQACLSKCVNAFEAARR
jgi:hypothetical protein